MRENINIPGAGITLEGELVGPEGAGLHPAVVVCHPHPLYGGSMDNNVVGSVCDALAGAGFLTLKFNFRGVGASQGQHTGGPGEAEDVAAALCFLETRREADKERLGLVGYSAGAAYSNKLAAQDSRVKVYTAVSPPFMMDGFTALKNCPKPKLLITGGLDDFCPETEFRAFCEACIEPKTCLVVAHADHFWWGHESALTPPLVRFFAEHLGEVR